MTDERYCANAECGRPLVLKEGETVKHFLRRKTCGKSCGSKAGRQTMIANGSAAAIGRRVAGQMTELWAARNAGWPQITGEFKGSFHGTDVRPNDGGVIKILRPDSRSYIGCAAARCVE